MWDYNKSINIPLLDAAIELPSSFKSFVSKRMERKVCEQTLSASTGRCTLTATSCYIWQCRFQIRFSRPRNFNRIRIIRLCFMFFVRFETLLKEGFMFYMFIEQVFSVIETRMSFMHTYFKLNILHIVVSYIHSQTFPLFYFYLYLLSKAINVLCQLHSFVIL